MEQALAEINRVAALQTHSERNEGDYCPMDCGNYDDARGEGIEDGEIFLARRLLKMIEPRIKVVIPIDWGTV